MGVLLSKEAKEDLLARGYSRRQFGRISALLGLGSAAMAASPLLSGTAAAKSAAASPKAPIEEAQNKSGMVRIGSNECWTGPFPTAAQAGAAVVPLGNRYEPSNLREQLIQTVSQVEKVPETHILPWPGSSDPLSRTVVTFCSPTRGLVTADPTFEASWRTASWLGVKVTKVPLRAENKYVTDVRAMLKADPNAGIYYVCSPNNPTGTVTPLADIKWLVAHKPEGSIVLVDEAYIHFSGAPSAAKLVAENKDVVVLRTFSKLFAMAGLRLGLSMARPDLHEKMMRYDGLNQSGTLSIVALATGTASLTQTAAIAERRSQMIAVREATFAHLKKRGLTYLPSEANMFMVDWKQPAQTMRDAFAARKIDIGRNWPIWPTMSRVTVGSAEDMKAFCDALDQIMV
ncbi:pyridoxal phosphate-dependent aminotransferase [Komagataeibacter sp. AV436]|uniref:Pyridoxal phosphate-dependent aminotransferase n=1 Tax=Komagataeibacter melomenusus TaxID=2766578 RepID=A0ABX2AD30_9PROT|nr:pyridoxal phosphate-dependent aminotransferase [Komagataeibacter melomenusus]MBV1830141.1 pyridoxal phosphate-dependent aminotransferase [Komagataeibacter melomenusus]NPC65552.1 pyridoxal phosphate-dependent aminotransferase [Komagataeibacter melomenusus]